MTVLLRLAMVAKHANFSCDLWIVCGDYPSLPASTQVLSRIEAESSRNAHRPPFLPAMLFSGIVGRPVSLTSILNHQQVLSFREPQDGVHVRHLPVHRH